jgi:hypothetical protein
MGRALDLMRAAITAFLPLPVILVGCAETSPLPPPSCVLDGIPIYGNAQTLPKSQIRAAIAEDRRWPSHPEDKIYSIEVASSSEVHIYHTGRNKHLEEYNVLRRIHGGWEARERMISGSALLSPPTDLGCETLRT